LNKIKFKICGIKNIKTIDCCIKNKVDFYGLIFYLKSPRSISINNAIKLIAYSQNKPIIPVGVFVNKPLYELIEIIKNLKLTYVQLHGSESSEYITNLKKNTKIKVIKNISVKNANDFKRIKDYFSADFLLFDYKPSNKDLPGGNAKKFDWQLLKKIKISKPWFISGGINIDNINEIKKYAIPYGIDISSGVEVILGNKNINKINSLFKIYDAK
jgi:phosphoribosylanthranilate isomerase